jgi:hypothetical protein
MDLNIIYFMDLNVIYFIYYIFTSQKIILLRDIYMKNISLENIYGPKHYLGYLLLDTLAGRRGTR